MSVWPEMKGMRTELFQVPCRSGMGRIGIAPLAGCEWRLRVEPSGNNLSSLSAILARDPRWNCLPRRKKPAPPLTVAAENTDLAIAGFGAAVDALQSDGSGVEWNPDVPTWVAAFRRAIPRPEPSPDTIRSRALVLGRFTVVK